MRTARLVARLRDYDWAATAIELVIVVVGILIALQVSNWNPDRLDRARADSYYRRIHAELLTDRQNIDVTLAYWKKVATYGREAIADGATGKLADGSKWETILAYYQASQIMPFELSDTTFNEMRSTGDLALIANENLRKQLADYYRLSGTGITAMILHHDPVYRQQIRRLTPWHVQQYIWNKCFREGLGGNAANQQLIDGPSPISAQEASAVLESYRHSDTLLVNLRSWMSTLYVSAMVLDSTRHQTNRLAAEVQAARRR